MFLPIVPGVLITIQNCSRNFGYENEKKEEKAKKREESKIQIEHKGKRPIKGNEDKMTRTTPFFTIPLALIAFLALAAYAIPAVQSLQRLQWQSATTSSSSAVVLATTLPNKGTKEFTITGLSKTYKLLWQCGRDNANGVFQLWYGEAILEHGVFPCTVDGLKAFIDEIKATRLDSFNIELDKVIETLIAALPK